MKNNNDNKITVKGAVYTHKENKCRGDFNRQQTINIVLAIISIIAIMALIMNITTTNKNLDKIIYNAKKEAENTLASTGRMIYAEDVENIVGAGLASAINENLPENTETNPQPEGTEVLPKESWNIETVTAVSVGNGETVPVPIGFYYVGGDINTGVIISDNEEDKYDGTTDKTTWEYTTNLKGNQFVWIPCKEEEYKKCEVWNGITQKTTGTTSTNGILCNSGWDKTTYTSELSQIRKYEGFYVARYEAGLANTITEFTSIQFHNGSNQVYNKDGIPQSRAGVVPWNFIDWNHAQENAKNMYNTASVSSGLITGTQWDVMLNKMVEKGSIQASDLTSSGNWGNYNNNNIEYTGRMAKAYLSGGYWYITAFGGKTTSETANYNGSYNGELLTTGASSQTETYHIFDVAGNLYEWTDECSLYKVNNANETNLQNRVLRGGSFYSVFTTNPVCYRHDTASIVETGMHSGFRVVLYVK